MIPEPENGDLQGSLQPDANPADNSRISGADRQPHSTDPRRWSDGTWRTGEGALTHGVRRYELHGTLPERAQQHVDGFRSAVAADRGGEAEMSALEAGYVRRLSQLEGALELLGDDLAHRGVMTERGRPRAAYMTFLRTLDTWDRYAQRLGIERKTKQVDWARRLSGMER